ncbi:hypothetical protein J5N97_011059 [Dioscorea zingiberensis]|uniref:Uncharacterized protein n=1 Tax=Dioscorea zingiberensis TaxID=325984 RepID=A0A9D5HN53_9LILI|nr:hypothetical protein J5N97_011059 [Dioscorea zingiberensis]
MAIPSSTDDNSAPFIPQNPKQSDIDTCVPNLKNEKSHGDNNDKINETNDDPITIYSNSKKQDDNDIDDIDDEMTLRIEKEIEKEFEDMWKFQLGWEESQEQEQPQEEPNQTVQADLSLVNDLSKSQEEVILTPEGSPGEPDGGIPVPDEVHEEEERTMIVQQREAPEKPGDHRAGGTLKEIEDTNKGPGPDMDLSKHVWKHFKGSWILVTREAWDELGASKDTTVHTSNADNRQ